MKKCIRTIIPFVFFGVYTANLAVLGSSSAETRMKNGTSCKMTACELSESMSQQNRIQSSCGTFDEDIRWRQLERRLRAMEQSVWTISRHRDRWRLCLSDACRCDIDTKTFTCWRSGLTALSPEQLVPFDTRTFTLCTSGGRITFSEIPSDQLLDKVCRRVYANIDVIHNKKHETYISKGYIHVLTSSGCILDDLTPVFWQLDWDLGTNRLSTLHKDALAGLTTLVELDVFDNDLDYLPLGIFNTLKGLTTLRVQKNFLEELHTKLLREATKLVYVDFSHNQLNSLPENLFVNCYFIKTADFSYNKIAYLPADAFVSLNSVNIIDISRNSLNKIENGTFANLRTLKVLKLSDNKIHMVSRCAFDDLKSLETLLLRNNNISILPNGLFDFLKCLLYLDLSHNKLVHLLGNEFTHLSKVKQINLENNELTELAEQLLNNCTNLVKLDLSRNRLRYLNYTAFEGLFNLETLVLTGNTLHEIHFKVFFTLKHLTTLYLDNNEFPSLASRALDFTPKLSAVRLAGNPWHCDCHAFYISAWVRLNEMKLWDAAPACATPWSLEGRPLRDLKFPQLCRGQWASMVNLSPRLPIEQLLALNITVNRKPPPVLEYTNE